MPDANRPFSFDEVDLATDLAALYGRQPNVPAATDHAVAAAARQRAAHIRRMRLLLRWGGAAAAVAAAVLIVLRLASPPAPPVFHREARVTILDALSLARQIKAGAKIDRSWDVNGDGSVDQRDVDAIAQRAVQLPKEGTP